MIKRLCRPVTIRRTGPGLHSPRPVTLAALVKVAGPRWTIEEKFQAGKGLIGLDKYQVRRWTSWYR
jgi:SRSO17 transposase